MARSPKYKIQVDFREGTMFGSASIPDEWRVYVWESKWFFLGAYVGSRRIDYKPAPVEMEVIGRAIINEYLAKKNKKQGKVVYVRHP